MALRAGSSAASGRGVVIIHMGGSHVKISVVIPSYNQAQFLRQTLESVLRQDPAPWEVFVHDAGSTDGSLAILQAYDREIDFVSERDEGQADALNRGLQRTTGDILAYLNSDDIYYAHALERASRYFEAHPDCYALYGDAWHLHEDGSIMQNYHTEPWSYARLLETCFLCQPAVFWRREVTERFGLFDADLQYAMDYEYWLRVGREIEFHYLEGRYLAGSRLHGGAKTLKNRIEAHRESLKVVMRHSSEPPYAWLMHLARAVAEEERGRAAGAMDEVTRRALLVQTFIDAADEHGIVLDYDVLSHLEDVLDGKAA